MYSVHFPLYFQSIVNLKLEFCDYNENDMGFNMKSELLVVFLDGIIQN